MQTTWVWPPYGGLAAILIFCNGAGPQKLRPTKALIGLRLVPNDIGNPRTLAGGEVCFWAAPPSGKGKQAKASDQKQANGSEPQ
jgi:hypothetical protein